MSVAALAQIGESLEGYTVLEALGHLGLAERYRVRSQDGKTHLMDVVAMQHPQLVHRLQSAELDRVDHPNLLAVHEVVSVLRFPGVVCADTVGIPLSQWRRTEPSLHDRLSVIRGIAAGLAALHAAGIQHGYLQPTVVIVEQQQGRPFARLGLAGVASVVFSILKEGGTVTTSGASLGGVGFQSPEQQRSPAQADTRSDLFSLGCLLYYLLVGTSPFHKLDPLACYEAARNERYQPLGSQLPDALKGQLPPDVVSLVQELLRADPAARPPAEEVVARLDRVLPAPGGRTRLSPALVVLAILALTGLAVLVAGLLQ